MDKMPQKCTAQAFEMSALTYDVREVCLKLINPPELHFVAGQYITIEVTEIKDGRPRLNNRPYSIVSSPNEKGIIRLCTNRVGASGPGSSYLHALKQDDIFTFFSPIGYFTVDNQATTPLLFVATGTGIAPIKSMIHHLLETGTKRPITLYWGLRTEEDLYYQDELDVWARHYPLFRFVTTLSQPSSKWQGASGRVTHLLSRVLARAPAQVLELPEAQPHSEHPLQPDHLDAYLCGNGEMIREVRALLLSKGMPKKSIHFEKFY
jgi:NAD(P)H-flavin reductase